MKKLVKIEKKGNTSLYGSFLTMTLLPFILAGIVMMLVCSYSVKVSIKDEVREDLKNVANLVLASYDAMYEGDYNVVVDGDEVIFYKGVRKMSGKYAFLDKVKEQTGVEVSLFFLNSRVLTTITDKEGLRMDNTGASDAIVESVIEQTTPQFYDNVVIAGRDYYVYYAPIFSSDGQTCLGMVGTARTTEEVGKQINKSVMRNVAVMLVMIAITAFCILKFASGIMLVIKKMMEFMRELSQNNLGVQMDPLVSYRPDEMGEIGRSLVKLQLSLRKLIERDALTGLYNRRSADKRVDDIEEMGFKYSVAIGDIDFFKKFNDNFGHECGDVVLKEVAKLLNDAMTGRGFVARWGGEEFLMVFENADIDEAYVALLNVRDKLHENKVEYNGQEHSVTMTFGVAEKQEGVPINKLICAADEKLYEGKQNGRDRVIR